MDEAKEGVDAVDEAGMVTLAAAGGSSPAGMAAAAAEDMVADWWVDSSDRMGDVVEVKARTSCRTNDKNVRRNMVHKGADMKWRGRRSCIGGEGA
jgi:hypothetical protein